jgi:hypothetical protein
MKVDKEKLLLLEMQDRLLESGQRELAKKESLLNWLKGEADLELIKSGRNFSVESQARSLARLEIINEVMSRL